MNGVRLGRDVGGDGAGFLAYLFGGTDIGERAPTGIMWKKPISFVNGAGFPACLFGGTDIRAPTVKFFGELETSQELGGIYLIISPD
ncbi:MAG: hypothetical protein RLZZ338_4212 [Cyanobacteriota bacterium]